MRRLAVLADIHGNRWALEAVLAHMDRRSIDTVVNLGDALYGPLDPRGTAELLLEREMVSVCGNEDRVIVEPSSAPLSSTLASVRRSLEPRHLEWLQALPATAVVSNGIFACHASPTCDTGYLLWEVLPAGPERSSPEQVRQRLKGVEAAVVLCGHDHVPHTLQLPDGTQETQPETPSRLQIANEGQSAVPEALEVVGLRLRPSGATSRTSSRLSLREGFPAGPLVVNPGSVGLPAYFDEEPHPHVMQTHTPHARYAVLSETAKGWNVEQHAITYDWVAAARCAEENNRHDWAAWLASGQAYDQQ